MTSKPVIALDGPSGSGKSSTARGVARALNLDYLDTGAMYRALTWALLHDGVDVRDDAAVTRRMTDYELASGTNPEAPTICVNGVDVSGRIRSDEVTTAVSHVAQIAQVRRHLVQQQRQVIAASQGIVVEGRDIGTVVAPEARVKIFLIAEASTRASRRALEVNAEVETTAASLQVRDEIDSTRTTSPLLRATDAVVVDGTHLTLEDVVAHICCLSEGVRDP